MTVGNFHAWAIQQLIRALINLEESGSHFRAQQPITIRPHHEPEPDGAIVLARADDYKNRHPRPADTLCVIEVADSSLATDRTDKMEIYANARIPQYIIVNLVDHVVEDYRVPEPGKGRYKTRTIVRKGQSVSLHIGRARELKLPAGKILP
jgi:Uma2 family endonuclease